MVAAPSEAMIGLHPIEEVAGKAVLLTHVVDLQLRDPSNPSTPAGNAFSRSTCAALRRAAAVPATETEDGRPVIDPGSYMRAELAIAAERIGDQTDYAKPNEVVLGAIRSSGPAEIVERLKALVGAEPEKDALSEVVVSPGLTEMLAHAARITEQVLPGQYRVDARHALVACMFRVEGQQALWTEGLADPSEQPSYVIDRIRAALEDALAKGAIQGNKAGEPPDDESQWRSVLSLLAADADIRRPEPERRSDTGYVRDEPARTLADDRLGIADEARALAEVICLKEPGPPLAVGLFGDWGSGKSSYMNLVEAAIEELVERNADEDARSGLFVSGVAHIKFNAWHYNDADLWASLTSEFFRQLRNGGHAGNAQADYAFLVEEVVERVAKAEEESSVSEAALSAKRRRAGQLKDEIVALDRNAGKRRAQVLTDVVREYARSDGDLTGKVCTYLGIEAGDSATEKEEAVFVEVERALDFPGRLMAAMRGAINALAGRAGGLTGWIYVTAIVVAVILVALVWLQGEAPELLGGGVAAMFGALSVFGGIGAMVLQAYRSLEPLFRAADGVLRRVRQSDEEAAKEADTKRKELDQTEAAVADLETKQRKAAAEAARFKGASPQQVLDFFLNETETTRAFDNALGTVSRVRSAFEQLDAIFRARQEGKESAASRAKFDRIVLYIDDLDRCQAKQVVHVLEAVHLLLAFPLFVVIVGVDARWLEKSLLHFYEKTLQGTGQPGGGKDKPEDDRKAGDATVYDFLEKIFQVPIRLRRLSSLPGAAYSGYIRDATGPIARLAFGGQQDGAQAAGSRTSIEPVDVNIKPPAEIVAAGAQEVQLRSEEVAMFEALGPIAGKTPRAVKRFVNLYRLVRGMRRGSELDTFLAEGGLLQPFAAYQFWLAVDSGMHPEQTHTLRQSISLLRAGPHDFQTLLSVLQEEPSGRFTVAEPPPTPTDPPGFDELRAFWNSVPGSQRPAVHAAFEAVGRGLPGAEGMQVLQTALTDTRRFSAAADWEG